MPTPNDAKHQPAAQQAGTDPARKLVLVVEDESTISRIVVSYLEREGYRTEVARDGLQASQFVHTFARSFLETGGDSRSESS